MKFGVGANNGPKTTSVICCDSPSLYSVADHYSFPDFPYISNGVSMTWITCVRCALHFFNVGVAIRDRSLLTRIRDALTSWTEGRHRHSSLVAPTPIDPASNPAVFAGYGSVSEVPTEFNPTLPPPPARSLGSAGAGDAAVGGAVS